MSNKTLESSALISRLEAKFEKKVARLRKEISDRKIRRSLVRLRGLDANQIYQDLDLGTPVYS